MTSLILLLSPSDSHVVTLELMNGKQVTIDLLPLKTFLEKLFSEPGAPQQIQDAVNVLLKELAKTSLELAEHVASFMLLLLKNASVQKEIGHPSS